MSGRCRNSTCRPCPPLVCSEGGHRLRCRVGAARAVLSPSSRPHHATLTPYFPAPALHRMGLQGLCSSPTPRRPATTTLRRTIDDSQQRCADRGETHRDTRCHRHESARWARLPSRVQKCTCDADAPHAQRRPGGDFHDALHAPDYKHPSKVYHRSSRPFESVAARLSV